MKRLAIVCSLAAIGLYTAACKAPDTHDADVSAVKATEAQWNQDFASRDPDKLAAHYADDAVLMISGIASVTGKDAIHGVTKQMETDPAFQVVLHADRVIVAKSGEIAYTQGTYTLTTTNPDTKQVEHDRGSYVTTYAKQADGAWKAVADISTSEPPASPAAELAK